MANNENAKPPLHAASSVHSLFPDVKRSKSSGEFAQLGLLAGNFTCWKKDSDSQQAQYDSGSRGDDTMSEGDTSSRDSDGSCHSQANQYPQYLAHLIRWALDDLPTGSIGGEYSPRFGISAEGFALIYYTILQAKKRLNETLKQDDVEKVKKALINLGIPDSIQQRIKNPQTDYERYSYTCFRDDVSSLLHNYTESPLSKMEAVKPHFAQAPHRRNYIWLDKKDSCCWIEAIRKTLDELNNDKKYTLYDIMRISERLECCVFAPLDFQNLPCQINGVLLTSEKQKVDDAVKDMRNMQMEVPPYLYLSWDLLAFDYWGEKELLYRTMLALWTKWPRDEVWAPCFPDSPPKVFSSSPSFSLEEARFVLTELLSSLRYYFFGVKDAYRLPSESPVLRIKKDEPQTCYPPTFYFADPSHRLSTTSAYVEDAAARHLLSHCLGYDDPHADGLSWATLEGDIATVRGEQVHTDHYKPRYLLLPISGRFQSEKEKEKDIGADIDNIVDILSFREYTTALEAVEIHKELDDLEKKIRGVEILEPIVHRLVRAVPALSTKERENCFEEFAPLQLGLSRIQSGLERMRGDAIQLEQQYKAFVEHIKVYLSKYIVIASVPDLLSLPSAMRDTYLHRSLQQPMREVSLYISTLTTNNERINSLLTLLSTATAEKMRKRVELMNILIAVVGVIVGVIVGIFGSIRILELNNPNIIKAITSDAGQYILSLVTACFIALLTLCFLFSFLSWPPHMIIRHRVKRESKKFHKHVQKFWQLALYTSNSCKRDKNYKKRNNGIKDLSRIWPVLDPAPTAWFRKLWNDDNKGRDYIDKLATQRLKDLVSCLEKSPSRGEDLEDLEKSPSREDIVGEDIVCIARRLIYTFILYPEMIPLPRTLCIMRCKSIKFLGESIITDNEFHDSLKCAGFSDEQVDVLRSWLNAENGGNVKQRPVDQIAQALKDKHVEVPPPKDFKQHWKDSLC